MRLGSLNVISRSSSLVNTGATTLWKFGEKDAEWYDEMLDISGHYCQHYTESAYYALWAIIADRIIRGGYKSVLDVGCGTGQLAMLLRDRGLNQYRGFDFSEKRIYQARRSCTEFDFIIADAFETDLFTSFDYDAVIMTEFLEHIEKDIDVLEKIPVGTRIYASVPNFMYVSHVRKFKDIDAVKERYGEEVADIDVISMRHEALTIFLFEGIKT